MMLSFWEKLPDYYRLYPLTSQQGLLHIELCELKKDVPIMGQEVRHYMGQKSVNKKSGDIQRLRKMHYLSYNLIEIDTSHKK